MIKLNEIIIRNSYTILRSIKTRWVSDQLITHVDENKISSMTRIIPDQPRKIHFFHYIIKPDYINENIPPYTFIKFPGGTHIKVLETPEEIERLINKNKE